MLRWNECIIIFVSVYFLINKIMNASICRSGVGSIPTARQPKNCSETAPKLVRRKGVSLETQTLDNEAKINVL